MMQKIKWHVLTNRCKKFYKSLKSLIVFLAALATVAIFCSNPPSCQKGNGGDSDPHIVIPVPPKPSPQDSDPHIVIPVPPKPSPQDNDPHIVIPVPPKPSPKPTPFKRPVSPIVEPEEQAVVQILDCVECKAVLEGTAKGEAIVSDDALHYRIMAQINAEKKIKNKVLLLLTGSSFRINKGYAKKIIAQGEMIDAEFEIKGNKAITKITYRFEVPY